MRRGARRCELVYDDKLRAELAPGLNTLLSGPITLKVDASAGEGRRKVEADLTSAKLELPWIGWSKARELRQRRRLTWCRKAGCRASPTFNSTANPSRLAAR